jgi:hypothetical protein
MLRAELLAEMHRFEDGWDARLGGVLTRGYRELLVYIAGRLFLNGAALEDVFLYVRECLDRFGPTGRGPVS